MSSAMKFITSCGFKQFTAEVTSCCIMSASRSTCTVCNCTSKDALDVRISPHSPLVLAAPQGRMKSNLPPVVWNTLPNTTIYQKITPSAFLLTINTFPFP
jgi:hypothetical protein